MSRRPTRHADVNNNNDEIQLIRRRSRQPRVLRVHRPKRHNPYRCCRCSGYTLRLVVGIIALLSLIPILVMVILIYMKSVNVAESAWCPVLTGQEVIDLEGSGAGGVAGQRAITSIKMDGNSLHIMWDVLKQAGNISVVNTFQICGPLTTDDPIVSPNCTSLCGPPSTLVCEGVDPGEFSGDINALQPNSVSPEPFIKAVRMDPDLYYVYMEAANGNLRASLAVGCASAE